MFYKELTGSSSFKRTGLASFMGGKLLARHRDHWLVHRADVCQVRVHVEGTLDTANSNEC